MKTSKRYEVSSENEIKCLTCGHTWIARKKNRVEAPSCPKKCGPIGRPMRVPEIVGLSVGQSVEITRPIVAFRIDTAEMTAIWSAVRDYAKRHLWRISTEGSTVRVLKVSRLA